MAMLCSKPWQRCFAASLSSTASPMRPARSLQPAHLIVVQQALHLLQVGDLKLVPGRQPGQLCSRGGRLLYVGFGQQLLQVSLHAIDKD